MADVSGAHRFLAVAVSTALVGGALYALGTSSGTAPPKDTAAHTYGSSSAGVEDPTGSIVTSVPVAVLDDAPSGSTNASQDKTLPGSATESDSTPEPEEALLGEQPSIDGSAETAEPLASAPVPEPSRAEAPEMAAVEPVSPNETSTSESSDQPNRRDTEQAAKAIAPQAVPPALPLRKPIPRSPTTTVAEARPAKPKDAPQTKHQAPMSLGPAETTANRSPSASGYKMKVWSALARHKPRAGQRGSAIVRFGINAGGRLSFVQVSRSSGNSRLDQLALRTVRSAAPFPTPPESLRGRPYTIRIDFN